MDSFVQHSLDGLSLGVIYGVLATAFSFAGCAGRSFAFTNTAGFLFAAAVFLTTLVACAALGIQYEFVALPIAFTTALAAVSASAWVIGANPQTFAPRQRGLTGLLAPAGVVILAAAALDFANHVPPTNYLRLSPASRVVFGVQGLFQTQIAPEKLVIVITGPVMFAILLRVIRTTRFGRNYRAIGQDRDLAGLFGIDVVRAGFVTTLISVGIAAIAGCMMVLSGTALDVNDAVLASGSAFAAAFLSGPRSVPRAAAGGFVAGVATAMWSDFVSPVFGALVIFAILLFLLAFSPSRSATARFMEKI
jgi:branched-chain amino acid transport system permease protein